MSVITGAAAVPHALNVLPTAAAAAVLCGLVIAEIAGLPGMLLPGGTMTLLAGALIGSGRPALAVAVPVAAAVIAAAQMPYRGFTLRLLALRLPWLAGLLAAGALAAHSLAAIGRVAGIAGLAASAAAAAALLAARGRLPVRAIARRPQARLALHRDAVTWHG